jgi:hypothetical protein
VDWKTARARAARSKFLGTWGGMVKNVRLEWEYRNTWMREGRGRGVQVFIKQQLNPFCGHMRRTLSMVPKKVGLGPLFFRRV